MNQQKQILIDRAKWKHGDILPCGGVPSLMESFSLLEGYLVLWYKTRDGSTHIEREELAPASRKQISLHAA